MHPFIDLGPVQLPVYGLMIYIGILAMALSAWRESKKRNIKREDMLYGMVLALLSSGVFAKVLYLITVVPRLDWTVIRAEGRTLEVIASMFRGGFVIYGALFGGFLGFYLYAKKYKIKPLKLIGVFAPGLPLAQAFGRIGCHFSGCCYGIPYDGPLAVTFPLSEIHTETVSRFPVQLAMSLSLFVISWILHMISSRLKRRADAGAILFAGYLILYCIHRFGFEFLRGDTIRGIYGPFSQAQYFSILTLVIGVVLLIATRQKRQKRTKKNK